MLEVTVIVDVAGTSAIRELLLPLPTVSNKTSFGHTDDLNAVVSLD